MIGDRVFVVAVSCFYNMVVVYGKWPRRRAELPEGHRGGAGRGRHTSVYKTCNTAVDIVSGWEKCLDNSGNSTNIEEARSKTHF